MKRAFPLAVFLVGLSCAVIFGTSQSLHRPPDLFEGFDRAATSVPVIPVVGPYAGAQPPVATGNKENDGLSTWQTRVNLYKGSDPARWASGLVDDPEIVYSVTLETVDPQDDMAIAGAGVKPNGNLVVAGTSSSPEIKNAPAPVNPSSGFDIYVAEIDTSQTELVWITWIGGSTIDGVDDVKVDEDGNIYLIGSTFSSGGEADFPVLNAFQPEFGGGTRDGVVVKFDPQGAVIFSSYFGGSENDFLRNLSLGPAGELVIGGYTASPDFPLMNSMQSGLAGDEDLVIAMMSSEGQLLYSTLLGGSDEDRLWGLDLDSDGKIWITGEIKSTDFPTVRPIDATLDGTSDAFVASIGGVFNGADPVLDFSTYFGGENRERGNDIAYDAGAILVSGVTNSDGLPVVNAVQPDYAGGLDGFAMALDTAGGIVYSTYNGTDDFDEFNFVRPLGNGCAYAVGSADTLAVGRTYCLDGTAEELDELSDLTPFTMTRWFEDENSITFFIAGAEERDPGFGATPKQSSTGNRTAPGLGVRKERALMQSELSIFKSTRPSDSVGVGTSFYYTIVVRNDSPVRAENVVVSDQFPAGVEIDVLDLPKQCSLQGVNLVRCEIGSINPFDFRVIELFASADSVRTIANVAFVEMANPEADTTNNRDTVFTTVLESATLSVDYSIEDGAVSQHTSGEVIVKNTSQSVDAVGVELFIGIDLGLENPDFTSSKGECSLEVTGKDVVIPLDPDPRESVAVVCDLSLLRAGGQWLVALDLFPKRTGDIESDAVAEAVNAARAEDTAELEVSASSMKAQVRHESSGPGKVTADVVDTYLDDSLVVAGLPAGASSATIDLTLRSNPRRVDWVDGNDPDNTSPLASFLLDLITVSKPDSIHTATDAVLLTLLASGDSLDQIVSRDFRSEAVDRSAVDFMLTNGANVLVSARIRGDEPGRPVLEDLGEAFAYGESSTYGTVPAQPVLVDITADDGSLETFAIDLSGREGAAAVGLLTEAAGKTTGAAGFQLSVFDASGEEIANRIVTSTPSNAEIPIRHALHSAYPNPLNPSTVLAYDLPVRSRVRIDVFDVSGRLVQTLIDAEHPAGRFKVIWEPSATSGGPELELSSGIYLVRMQAGSFSRSRKVVLVR